MVKYKKDKPYKNINFILSFSLLALKCVMVKMKYFSQSKLKYLKIEFASVKLNLVLKRVKMFMQNDISIYCVIRADRLIHFPYFNHISKLEMKFFLISDFTRRIVELYGSINK